MKSVQSSATGLMSQRVLDLHAGEKSHNYTDMAHRLHQQYKEQHRLKKKRKGGRREERERRLSHASVASTHASSLSADDRHRQQPASPGPSPSSVNSPAMGITTSNDSHSHVHWGGRESHNISDAPAQRENSDVSVSHVNVGETGSDIAGRHGLPSSPERKRPMMLSATVSSSATAV